MRKAPLMRFTLASLALACSQVFAGPSPYSTLIVFGDSLADAGQFPDLTGGTPAPGLPTAMPTVTLPRCHR